MAENNNILAHTIYNDTLIKLLQFSGIFPHLAHQYEINVDIE